MHVTYMMIAVFYMYIQERSSRESPDNKTLANKRQFTVFGSLSTWLKPNPYFAYDFR